jgi:hypothetical protein
MPKRNTSMRFNADTLLIAVVSDLHCGGTTALCPPQVALDDGGHYTHSKAQRWLWDGWHRYWESVEKQRDKLKADLIVVCNGDAVDGNHHGTTQILSGNPTAQAAVLNEVLRAPLALEPTALLFVRGTEAHVGPSAAFEERVAVGLKKDGRPVITDVESGTASWWKWVAEFQDVKLDFAHHGKIGIRPWTKMTAVNSAAYEIWSEAHMRGERHPDLAVRSHMHRYADTYNAYPTRLIQTGAWQLATAYVHKIAPNTLADIGAITIVIRDGKCEVEPFFLKPKPPAVWRP